MRRNFLFGILLIVVGLSSCSSTSRMATATLPEVHLDIDDLEITEPVWAESTSVFVFSINWKRLFNSGLGDFIPNVYGIVPVKEVDCTNKAMRYSLYNLMKANPGYDMVMYPQFVIKKRKPFLGLGFIYQKIYVKVTARMARLKL